MQWQGFSEGILETVIGMSQNLHMFASSISGAVICSAGGVFSGCCKMQPVVGSRCIGVVAGAAEKAFGGIQGKERGEEKCGPLV